MEFTLFLQTLLKEDKSMLPNGTESTISVLAE